jgi:ubiquinone biosynthesis protein COQ9
MTNDPNLQESFLTQLIETVELKGWSTETLEDVCSQMSLSPLHYRIWFPNGINDILTFLEDRYDKEMLDFVESEQANLGVTQKINLALKTRILNTSRSKMLALKNSYYYLMPQNSIDANKSVWKTVDLIWRFAGDKSTDFNYYSKRTLLHGVYVASQAYYHLDESENHIRTQKFIESSLNQVVSSAKCLKKIPSYLGKIPILRMFI